MYNSEITSEPYISSYSFCHNSNHGMVLPNDTIHIKNHLKAIDPTKVKLGDVIFLISELLPHFFNNIHPKINHPYILITGRSDIHINDSYLKYIDDKIIRWYSVNMSISSKKCVPIPLGLQNLNWSYDGNPQSDINLLEDIMNETHIKTNDILLSFRKNSNYTERTKCYDYFIDKPFVKERKYDEKDRRSKTFVADYFREIKKSKFVLCPWGNGVDCHRNYETWYLGSFPIIKKHKALEMLYDLPAWWVDSWEDVTEDKMNEKYVELVNMSFEKNKLYFDYWWEKIKKDI